MLILYKISYRTLATFNFDGKWLKTSSSSGTDRLPEDIASYIENNYSNYKIVSIVYFETELSNYYAVKVKDGKCELPICTKILSKKGKFLKLE